MLYVFKPFWSFLTKGGEAYELIVFKRVHMGGCYNFCQVVTTVILDTFGSLGCNTLTWWSSATFPAILWCDDKFRMKSFRRRPFFIMHVIIFAISLYAWWVVFISWRGSPQSKTYHLHLHSKANYLYAHLQGEPFCYLRRQYLNPSQFHILLSSLKTSTSLSLITKKGEMVSASSATPSWFWSIDDKPGWGTNVFVRIAG